MVVDCGASYLVTSHRDIFSTYIDDEFRNVKMMNNVEYKIVRIGDVYMCTNARCKLCLKDVRHVHEIRLNSIPIFHSFYSEGTWTLTKGVFGSYQRKEAQSPVYNRS